MTRGETLLRRDLKREMGSTEPLLEEEIERLKIIEKKYKDSQLYIHDFKEEIEKLNNIINKAIEKINDYKIYCENNKGFTEYTDIEIEAIEPVISKLEDILKEEK